MISTKFIHSLTTLALVAAFAFTIQGNGAHSFNSLVYSSSTHRIFSQASQNQIENNVHGYSNTGNNYVGGSTGSNVKVKSGGSAVSVWLTNMAGFNFFGLPMGMVL